MNNEHMMTCVVYSSLKKCNLSSFLFIIYIYLFIKKNKYLTPCLNITYLVDQFIHMKSNV